MLIFFFTILGFIHASPGSIKICRNALRSILIYRENKFGDETVFYSIQKSTINELNAIFGSNMSSQIDSPFKKFKKLVFAHLIQPSVINVYSKRFSDLLAYHSKSVINFLPVDQCYTHQFKRKAYFQHISRNFGRLRAKFLQLMEDGMANEISTFLFDFYGDDLWKRDAIIQAIRCYEQYILLLDFIDPLFQSLFHRINDADIHIDLTISKYISLVENQRVEEFLFKLNFNFNGGILLCIFYLYNYLHQLSKLYDLSNVIVDKLREAHKCFLAKSYKFAMSVYDQIIHVAEVPIKMPEHSSEELFERFLCDDIYLLPSFTDPTSLKVYDKCIKLAKFSYHKMPLDWKLVERYQSAGFPFALKNFSFFLTFFNFCTNINSGLNEMKIYSTNKNTNESHFFRFIQMTVNRPFILTVEDFEL